MAIDAGTFTNAEWPFRDSLSWSIWSIGEELSERDVIALEWSSPGLGQFGRPVLAVLTANAALSIWECRGRTDIKGDWHRVLLLNHILQSSANGADTNVSSDDSNTRAASRIRSFSWTRVQGHHDHTPALGGLAHCIAVSNDLGDISLLAVRSPYDLSGREPSSWTCNVLASFDARPGAPVNAPLSSCLPTTFKLPSHVADDLTWGPWFSSSSACLSSTLAYTVNSRVHFCKIQLVHDQAGWHVTYNGVDTSQSTAFNQVLRAPPKWLPTSQRGPGADDLLLITVEGFFRAEVPTNHSQSIAVGRLCSALASNHQITSVSISADEIASPLAMITSYDPDLAGSVRLLHTSGDGAELKKAGVMVDKVKERLLQFGKKHNVAERVIARVRGALVSPRGDLSLTCTTIHPSEGLEYTIEARQNTLVVIAQQWPPDEGFRSAILADANRSTHLASDFIIISLQESIAQGQESHLSMLENLIRTPGVDVFGYNATKRTASSTPHSMDQLTSQFRSEVLLSQKAGRVRANTLLELAKGRDQYPVPPNLEIVKTVSSSVTKIRSESYVGHQYSTLVFEIHKTIWETLHAREQGTEEQAAQPQGDISEQCSLCGSDIKFEALQWSRCQKGHQFSRCTLTFLSIQGSRTKTCGICRAPYLNEFEMPALQIPNVGPEANDSHVSEPLLRVMFTACNVCIYCGGRYVG